MRIIIFNCKYMYAALSYDYLTFDEEAGPGAETFSDVHND